MSRGLDFSQIEQLGRERDQAIVRLATSLGRFRSLTDEESLLLEAAIMREDRAERGQSARPRWSDRDDALLRQLHRSVPQSEPGWAQIGKQLDPPRTPFAVKKRIFELGLRCSEQSSQARMRAGG